MRLTNKQFNVLVNAILQKATDFYELNVKPKQEKKINEDIEKLLNTKYVVLLIKDVAQMICNHWVKNISISKEKFSNILSQIVTMENLEKSPIRYDIDLQTSNLLWLDKHEMIHPLNKKFHDLFREKLISLYDKWSALKPSRQKIEEALVLQTIDNVSIDQLIDSVLNSLWYNEQTN